MSNWTVQSVVDAARLMDWQQVVRNGGPPCFAQVDKDNGRFCGRAQRWVGHDSHHRFVSLDALLVWMSGNRLELESLRTQLTEAQATIAEMRRELEGFDQMIVRAVERVAARKGER